MHRLVIAALFLAAALPCYAADPEPCPTPWNYSPTGENGPAHWGKFSEVCATGFQQSPININSLLPQPVSLPTLSFGGGSSKFKVKNTSRNLKVYLEGGTWTLEGFAPTAATLEEFHFHFPAEHQRGATRYAGEIHFVYALGSRKVVIAVSIVRNDSSGNAALQKIIGVGKPGQCFTSNPSNTMIAITEMLNAPQQYAVYNGSLTTPPCSENVTFIIELNPINATIDQINALAVEPPPGNKRPLQGMKWQRQ